MGASLLELLAKGEQDIPLIGNPQFSYFNSVYRRHTNFAIEPIPQYFSEKVNFGKKVVCKIDKRADMLNAMFLEIELPALQTNVSWINGIGNHIIKTIELQIGGVMICRMTGEYLNIYGEISSSEGKRAVYYKMIGKFSSYNRTSQSNGINLFIPLPFWFCKNIESSLPLIGMQCSEIKIIVEFRQFSECWYSGTNMSITPTTQEITNAMLYCDYIFLDTHERRKMASKPDHTFLIEQVQWSEGNTVSASTTHNNIDFKFNHPVKELIWIYQANNVNITNDWGNYSITLDDDTLVQSRISPLTYCTYQMNGNERFSKRLANYFRYVVPWQRHTSVNAEEFIYLYSFSLYPEEHQPSGSCNMSRIENNQFQLEYTSSVPAGDIRIYAINYNIIRIKNGMTGLAYS